MSFSTTRLMRASLASCLTLSLLLGGCASNIFPERPRAEIPVPDKPSNKYNAINRKRDQSVTYVDLGDDVLRPIKQSGNEKMSDDEVGPLELHNETLASALQLILAGKKIPIAFQTNTAMTRTVTVTELKGPLYQVVDEVCSLADLYCSYKDGTLLVKDTETFTVSLPPMIADDYGPFVDGLKAITAGQTYVDALTHSLIYTTSVRNQERAKAYFDRLRANTALIVYEIQIWEVQLTDKTQLGIDWDSFNIGSDIDLLKSGTAAIEESVGIGASISAGDLSADVVLNFLQTQGAVKTVSQPHLTVLSGSTAKLRVGNSQDYVSQITRTVGVNTNDNVSVTTSKLETGLSMEIDSAWDNGTVYGNLKLNLQNLIKLEAKTVGTTEIQLPQTSDRNVETKLRVRPGDAVIIGGIVEDRDDIAQQGIPGRSKPSFLTKKTSNIGNTELVFMLRPRVVIYRDAPESKDTAPKIQPVAPVPVPATVLPATVPMAVAPTAPAAVIPSTSVPSKNEGLPTAQNATTPSSQPLPAVQAAQAAKPAGTLPPIITQPSAAPFAPMPQAPMKLTPKPLDGPSMSEYLDALPADQIAPAQ